MNSFKKIAFAMVAALASATIIATPASAAPMSVVVEKGSSTSTWTAVTANTTPTGLSATSAVSLTVPADNSVDVADVVRFTATVDTGTNVSVSTTNAFVVTELASSTKIVPASSGSTSLTVSTGTGTQAVFYVFTKTIAVGTITITNGGTTSTFYVQGTAGAVNTVSVSGDDVAAAGTQKTYTVTATDVFGNKVSGVALTATVSNATISPANGLATTGSGLTDYGTAEYKVTMATSGSAVAIFSIASSVTPQSAIAGFATPVTSVSKVVSNRDLVAELAAANAALSAEKTARAAADKALADEKAAAAAAKVAADKVLADTIASKDAEINKLKADSLAALDSAKKAFNRLAKKWNAKNPKSKVALLK